MGLLGFVAGSVGAAWTVVKGPDPADKTELSTHYAAEFARISRWMNKESIAVSLAGGGAYGLGHIGLLRRLQETGLPVDTVAGVSSGAVVAGMFTWRQDSVGPGKPSGLDELEKRHRQTLPIVLAAIVSMKPLERWLEAITGGTHSQLTEGRLLCFCTDVLGGHYAATTGTIGSTVADSSALSPVFASRRHNGLPVTDGGFSYNLPPEVEIWSSNNGFLVTSNVIPLHRKPRSALFKGFRSVAIAAFPMAERLRNFTYSVMWSFRRQTELTTLGSDLAFDPDLFCWGPSDFDSLKDIARRALDVAREQLSGPHDPAWAYWNWLWVNGRPTGISLGPPPNPPPPGPPAPTGCP